jgi:hypothetical protein
VLSIRRIGVGTQRANRPDNGVDNLDAPLDGPGQVHGSYPGRVLRHGLFTQAIGRRSRPGDFVTTALAGLRRPRPVTEPVRPSGQYSG